MAQSSGELLLQNMLAVKTFADWPICTANQLAWNYWQIELWGWSSNLSKLSTAKFVILLFSSTLCICDYKPWHDVYLFLVLRNNLSTLVNTTGEKLELVPPLDGGIDSQQSLQLFVSPVTSQYRNRSESLCEKGMRKVSRHVIPTNPDKIGMLARKGM